MSTMDDLAAWLTQIWDEDERLAKDATAGPWAAEASSCINRLPGGQAQESVSWFVSSPADDGENGWSMVAAVERDARDDSLWGGIWNPADAAHIARHDPKAVLARIAADRRILARLTALEDEDRRQQRDYQDWAPGKNPPRRPARFNSLELEEIAGLRIAVKLLALPHADRPGYQEAWKP
jgi:hypothetical protein